MSNELIEVEETTVLAAFVAGDGLDPIINQARELVNGFEPDLSTDKGRKAIASLAAKVAKLKVKLDDMGKELVGDWKAKSKIVDGSRKKMRDELDELKIKARAPLTEWESKEKDRILAHENTIIALRRLSESSAPEGEMYSLEGLKSNMAALEAILVDDSMEEYELQAVREKTQSIARLQTIIDKEQMRVDNEAELERMRAAEEERRQKERDEAMKREAAEEATRQAEAKAKEEAAKAETEKQEAINHAAESERKAEESERARIAAEEKSKIEQQVAAERARLEEVQRQEDELKAEKEAQEKREANKAHISKIRKAAKESLMQFVDEKTAVKIVLAMHEGSIKNVTLNY